MKKVLTITGLITLALSTLMGQQFVEMTAAVNLGATGFNRGIAIADFDNDGLEDIYVSRIQARNLLYRNLGNFQFEEVAEEYGVGSAKSTNAALWFDYDNDGDQDLFLGNFMIPNVLYRNDGTTFTKVTSQFGIGTAANTKTLHAADYDRDGDLDLYVTVFLGQNVLWRNEDGVAFTDVTRQVGIDDSGRSLSALFVDYDLDGDLDLYQTRDDEDPNLFWINNNDGTFIEASANVGLDYVGFGMGADIADLNGDLYPDIYLTNLHENLLYLSDGNKGFTEAGSAAGVADIGMGWSTFFLRLQ